MNNIYIIDESVDANLTLTYQLIIRKAEHQITIAILDSVRNKYILLKEYLFDSKWSLQNQLEVFKSDILKDDILNNRFKTVSFMYETKSSVIVPETLFDKNKLDLFFDFNQDIEPCDRLLWDKLNNAGAILIYSMPAQLMTAMESVFPNIKYFHHGTSMIENTLIQNKNRNSPPKLYININHSFFDIIILESSQLKLFNSFDYKSEDDFIYYVLLIFEQFKLNPEETEITLSGIIKKNDVYFQKIKKYIKNIRFEKLDDYFMYNYRFYEIEASGYTNLFNLYKCV
jgi:hypothetical protein